MENKKMDCWDFVFSFVKNHIDALVQQADKYTKEMKRTMNTSFAGMLKRCTKHNESLLVTAL